jgi:hypothetical protein
MSKSCAHQYLTLPFAREQSVALVARELHELVMKGVGKGDFRLRKHSHKVPGDFGDPQTDPEVNTGRVLRACVPDVSVL